MRKKSKPLELGGILHDLSRNMGFEDRFEQVKLYRLWQEAVGESVARNATPVLVRGSVLHVNVSSSVWVQQLHFLRSMLIEKINAGLSGVQITDIRFKVGPVAGCAADHVQEPCELPDLNPAEQQETRAAAENIQDPEVREAFQSFMAAYLKSHKPED